MLWSSLVVVCQLLFTNWFMVSVRLLTYGCTWEVVKHWRRLESHEAIALAF